MTVTEVARIEGISYQVMISQPELNLGSSSKTSLPPPVTEFFGGKYYS